MDIVKPSELFTSEYLWYWLTMGSIIAIPLFMKIYEKLNMWFFMPKEQFGLVMTNTPVQYKRYSILGKKVEVYTVEFELNSAAKTVIKREFDFDNQQKFVLKLQADQYHILKRIGVQQETGLRAEFARGRFGALYFLRPVSKISEAQIQINQTERQKNLTLHTNKNHDTKAKISQFDLQQKLLKRNSEVKLTLHKNHKIKQENANCSNDENA